MKVIEITPTYAEKVFIGTLHEAAAEAKAGDVIRLHLVKTAWTKSGNPRGLTREIHEAAVAMLKRYGEPFEEGNDAPRGGLRGDYIEVKIDRRRCFWTSIGL